MKRTLVQRHQVQINAFMEVAAIAAKVKFAW
jgi:hypothetical protein